MDINELAPRSGRVLKEDNSVVNEAEGINADGSRNIRLSSAGEIPLVPYTAAGITIPANAIYNAPNTVDLRGYHMAYAVAQVGSNDQCQVFASNKVFNGNVALYPFAGSATGANTLISGVAGPQTSNTNGFTGTELASVVNKSTTTAATLYGLSFIAN